MSSHIPIYQGPYSDQNLRPNFSSALCALPSQAEALKREVNALKSVLRMRGPHGQGDEIPPPCQSTTGELEQPDPLAASSADPTFLPGHAMTRGQPESSPSTTRPSPPGSPCSPPAPLAFPAASPQQVTVVTLTLTLTRTLTRTRTRTRTRTLTRTIGYPRRRGAAGEAGPGLLRGPRGRAGARHISPISPLYLPYISPISPLYLP